MNTSEPSRMRLYSPSGERLYLNISERKRYEDAARRCQVEKKRLYCLFLHYTGCRPTEGRNFEQDHLQVEEAVVSIKSLKKRDQSHVREIPIPKSFAEELDQFIRNHNITGKLWPISRTTAWDWVHEIMQEAGITGIRACAKGIRHGFGVCAAMHNISLGTIKKWLGHSSIKTTAIYTQITGKEERELAQRMWE